ncbi:hypothetical protein SteCoe_37477 [Stentor coeruleus]|uniref:C2 domain-containing protein n=1 Tax=Stentor coeruleus TaxID=5963 RepID=A0A1R2AN66_9CILI|nr:hypothetical protein SteCoe_37477 [Stentor coeruleus]
MVERGYQPIRIELFISARHLVNQDTFSKSDTFCVVSLQQGNSTSFEEVGRTEVIHDCLDPKWSKTIQIDYFFQQRQPITFTILDHDDSSPDKLGHAHTTLGELVGKGDSSLDISQGGTLHIHIEEVRLGSDSFKIRFRGIKLAKKDYFGLSDPYFILSKSVAIGEWRQLYKSEIIKETLDPIWEPFELTEQELCNCDRNRLIKFECYDWDSIGSDEMIGVFEVPASALLVRGAKFEIFDPSNKVQGGTIEITDVVVKKNMTFIDYLRAGVQISMSVAIDFTASNEECANPHSLHYIGGHEPNQYEKVIYEIASILEGYDTDKYIPVYGFGGVPHGSHHANHCFALSFDESKPYALGARGVIDLYRNALNRITFSGPTMLTQILQKFIAAASSTPPQSVYHILLVLTDGAINDMDYAVKEIVSASELPASIIIVGIGKAVFDNMEILDGDHGTLTDINGKKVSRDIVQFVPLRKLTGSGQLAYEVLKEVPNQLVSYMKKFIHEQEHRHH